MEITNCENFDISPKQIEENESKIIVDERLPSCSLSLIKKSRFDHIYYSKRCSKTFLIAFWCF